MANIRLGLSGQMDLGFTSVGLAFILVKCWGAGYAFFVTSEIAPVNQNGPSPLDGQTIRTESSLTGLGKMGHEPGQNGRKFAENYGSRKTSVEAFEFSHERLLTRNGN